MTRDISQAVKDAASAQSIHTAHLFCAVFTNPSNAQDESYYLTDNFIDVEYEGNNYIALGHFVSYEGAEETGDMAIATARFALAGVASEFVAVILSYRYINRPISVSRVFFDLETGQMIGEAVPVFIGTMDGPSVSDSPESAEVSVSLTASNHFAAFDMCPGRHSTHEEQQAYFPGDLCFEFVGNFDKSVTWGVD